MTKPELILTPRAREDIKQIAAYIGENNPQASMAFRQTLQHIYRVLLDLPEMGSVRNFRNPEMKGLRMLPVPKFKNYLLPPDSGTIRDYPRLRCCQKIIFTSAIGPDSIVRWTTTWNQAIESTSNLASCAQSCKSNFLTAPYMERGISSLSLGSNPDF